MRAILFVLVMLATAALAEVISPDILITGDGGTRLCSAREWIEACDVKVDAEASVTFYDTLAGDPDTIVATYGPWIMWADEARSFTFDGAKPDSAYVNYTTSGNTKLTPIR